MSENENLKAAREAIREQMRKAGWSSWESWTISYGFSLPPEPTMARFQADLPGDAVASGKKVFVTFDRPVSEAGAEIVNIRISGGF